MPNYGTPQNPNSRPESNPRPGEQRPGEQQPGISPSSPFPDPVQATGNLRAPAPGRQQEEDLAKQKKEKDQWDDASKKPGQLGDPMREAEE